MIVINNKLYQNKFIKLFNYESLIIINCYSINISYIN